jgi:hypothetical protein
MLVAMILTLADDPNDRIQFRVVFTLCGTVVPRAASGFSRIVAGCNKPVGPNRRAQLVYFNS